MLLKTIYLDVVAGKLAGGRGWASCRVVGKLAGGRGLRPPSPVSKADVEQLLPGGTRPTYQAFSRRGTCGRIYWHGAHSKRLVPIVESAIRAAAVTDRGSDQ